MYLKLFSNEIVFRGHPDKVCDQISAAILDEYLKQDKNSRCGIEVAGGKGKIFITGEITSKAKVNIKKVVNRVLKDIGYKTNYKIINNLGIQSPDISQGVDVGGAGDNGMMFGYACNDTKELLPTAMIILQRFAKSYDQILKISAGFLLPDGKAQITGYYDDDFKLIKIRTFTICYQNLETERETTDEMLKDIATQISEDYGIIIEEFLINPTGKFLIGGFDGDAGLTGRKIVVDSYQSFANVGGGNFNGKDPTKVDISGAYKARQLTCEILKEYNLKWCEVQLSYAIGKAEPLAIYIDSNDGNIEPKAEYYEECKPFNIIKDLKMLDICYEDKAKYGHFTE
jgi:S-adenosylmethionine synthetase